MLKLNLHLIEEPVVSFCDITGLHETTKSFKSMPNIEQ